MQIAFSLQVTKKIQNLQMPSYKNSLKWLPEKMSYENLPLQV